MSEQTLIVRVPASEFLSANARHHWPVRAKRTRMLRRRARYHALSQGIKPVAGLCMVSVYVQYAHRRRADPANTYPSVKAMLDGLTDAGVWVDDDSAHVAGPAFYREDGTCKKGEYVFRFVLSPTTL
ncbi:hypothetical protein [Schaalia sp. lx-100]|uniref:hypothetical protein n=1 Tax=Schaalia sp. lx-100 TaxID=2899081 RepID=UPI001E34223C|nr:hypothetical protein [Schaalia sp. lx-100]MCD4557631.1 hypothetical protein [Schaalia sp. lx-100]